MEMQTLTRLELYNLVWTEPLTAISKRLNVPYNELRKACQQMKVPVPQNGYWSKQKYGKPVQVIELPKDYDGTDMIQIPTFGEATQGSDIHKITNNLNIDIIKSDSSLPLKVPKRITNPDPLIDRSQKSLTEHPQAWWNSRGWFELKKVS